MGTEGFTFIFNELSPNWVQSVSACKYFVEFYTNSKNKDLAKFGGSITVREFFEGLAGYRPYFLPSLAYEYGWKIGDKIEVSIRPRKTLKGNTALEITTIGARLLDDDLRIDYEYAWCDTTRVITSADTGEKLELVDFRRRNGKELTRRALDNLTKQIIFGEENNMDCFYKVFGNAEIKKVIFNDPATIVFWDDGTKTVVKCKPGETFSEAAGLALCYMKKHEGNKFHKQLKKWLPKEDNSAADASPTTLIDMLLGGKK